ncbi:hypothetical protein Q5424_01205 [Conexibacter sp. JD483]|uniref:hypothetical protein n=1 Tax=unclassified Conexibacter TaxID=2627773 RepID=UPI00271DED4D|nr:MULTISPECIES: hypothetical protein [unclassified Conexibacter]MDO8185846.1 hypothetical protein [Conexibacter sp. CPCC 205706]MDO8198590.1 hypothetical protein [Conexibacter sp. CPCC 205762]MDR9367676.1 hypothetical protein [Conexibacter sp. JD483]
MSEILRRLRALKPLIWHVVWVVRRAALLATMLFALFMIVYLLTSPEAETMRDQWATGDRVALLSGLFAAWLLLTGACAVFTTFERCWQCARGDFDSFDAQARLR